jgi:hypothetical protein
MRAKTPMAAATESGSTSMTVAAAIPTMPSADHTPVSVAVQGAAADGLTVEIRNPWPVGTTRTTEIPGAGKGIIGLAERTALTGGRLEHGRTPAGEFRLWTWLPWPT